MTISLLKRCVPRVYDGITYPDQKRVFCKPLGYNVGSSADGYGVESAVFLRLVVCFLASVSNRNVNLRPMAP